MNVNDIVSMLKASGMKLLGGLLVLVIGFWLARLVIRWVSKRIGSIDKSRLDPTVGSFLSNLARIALYILVILTAVSVMGIPMTSVLTVIASAGVAISLALQGALSNLVGGLMLVVLKPIAVGEYVQISGMEGTVKGIGAIYTDLVTFDGKHVSLPNSNLTNTPIVNFTREGKRRAELTYSVSYGSDMERVMAVLRDLAAATPNILPDPAPVVHLTACSASSLDFVLRVWADNAHYWDVYFDLLENGKRALDRAGIEIPYQQLDVHLKNG